MTQPEPQSLQVGPYKLHGPLVNVGYGRLNVEVPDDFGGVGSNTNDQRDYSADQLIAEWGGGLNLRGSTLCYVPSQTGCGRCAHGCKQTQRA